MVSAAPSPIRATLRRFYASRYAVILQSVLIGLAAGFVVVLFRLALVEADRLRSALYRCLRTAPASATVAWTACLCAVGLFLGWMSARRPMIKGSGIPQLKGTLMRRLRMEWWPELPMKIVGGILSIGCGLSLGREGPSVQIGAYVGKGALLVARRPAAERKYLLTSGAAAGLAAAFNAPLAGVLFALEELHKHFSPLLLACAMGASVAGDFVASRFFGVGPVFGFRDVDPLALARFPWVVVLGALCALSGDLFKRALYRGQDLYAALRIPPVARPVLPLLASVPVCWFLFRASGGGHELIEALATEDFALASIALLFIVKLAFTGLSYGSGAAGGIFLPLLACGALVGAFFGKALGLLGLIGPAENLNFLVLGMAAFFTAVAKAPVTGAVLILEMSGNLDHLGSLVLACLSAYVVADLIKSRPVYDVLLERLLAGAPEALPQEGCDVAVVEAAVYPHSRLAHVRLRAAPWPDGCRVVGVSRGEDELVPTGETELLPGDRVVAVVRSASARSCEETLRELGRDRRHGD